MAKYSVLFITLSLLSASFFSKSVRADIEWSGVYRIEGYNLDNSELGRIRPNDSVQHGHKEINYALTHLVLRPKIVAGDGLTIYSQFEIFNNPVYPNSQMGAWWGSGVRDAKSNSTIVDNSNTLERNQRNETISISQLYLTYAHEYGSLIFGRVPLQFGLGMTYSAGRGLFDHWYNTDDLIGYKIVLGNLWVLPMIGKASGGAVNLSDDLYDYMAQVQYENPEADIEMGVFYQMRIGGNQGSDAPVPGSNAPIGSVLGGSGATNTGKVNLKTVSLYTLKDTERYRLGLEAAFLSGDSGVVLPNGDKVSFNGFGIASEFEYRLEGTGWKFGAKAGTASGDDPSTGSKFDGFFFNRNYDVAMLMFNHPLGVDDFFRTRLLTGNPRDTKGDTNLPDVETISNTLYVAPSIKYAFNDHWSLDNTVITGWLSTNPLSGGKNPGKSLGYEWDIALNFTPRKGITWVNEAGLLFPGEVWKGGGQYQNSFAFGLGTKAAISF